MNKMNWLVIGIISFFLLLFLFGGGMMMSGWNYRGGGMMGSGNIMGYWGSSPFGWLGMLFMGLVSIGLLTLIVLGIVWLVRKAGSPQS